MCLLIIICMLFSAVSTSHATDYNNHCCERLAEHFSQQLSYPSNDTYQQFLDGYWTERESELEPNCIFTAEKSQDVARAVGILGKTSQCKFAVRGVGHTGWPGAANIESGITFDLSRLDDTTTVGNTSVEVGAGARWNAVYEHLDALGLHIAGGRFASVGVAGLTLGGGISFFSARYGWVCDSVIALN